MEVENIEAVVMCVAHVIKNAPVKMFEDTTNKCKSDSFNFRAR